MPIEAGQQLLHYRLIEKIGEGGMGVVWKAEDTKLNRRVALKFLPEAMASDPERRARFEREAQAVAALNHPNIVTVYSVEKAEDASPLHFITMELVEGRTLSELLPRNGFPLRKLLDIAIPLADAVSRAHRAGITHRDLKPDNVMIDAEGRLRVLDFGLAKLGESSTGVTHDTQRATVTSDTEEGRVLGTVAYMSPEQAEGKNVDARSDVFSLGTILYELASGERPFEGETRMSTIGAILKDDPVSITERNRSLPRHAGRVIRRCMAKDPDRRYQTALDLRNELEELRAEIDSGVHEGAASAAGPRQWSTGRRVAAVVGAVVVIAAVVGLVRWLRPGASAPEVHFELVPLTSGIGEESGPNWSPGGEFIAYTQVRNGSYDVMVKPVAGSEAEVRADGPGDETTPRWSPDGRYVAYVTTSEPGTPVYLVPPHGGPRRKLIDTGLARLAASAERAMGDRPWSPDSRTLLVSRRNDVGQMVIYAVDRDNGTPEQMSFPPEGSDDGAPTFSFDGKRIAFARQNWEGTVIMAMPSSGGDPEELQRDASGPAFRPDGRRLLFLSPRGGGTTNIWELDLETKATRQLTQEYGRRRGRPPTVSSTDRVAYQAFWHDTFLFTVDVATGERHQLTSHTGDNYAARFSPNGKSVIYTSSRAGGFQVFLHPLDGGPEARLTDEGLSSALDWSPNGRELLLASNREDDRLELFVSSSDGGALRVLTDSPLVFPGVRGRWSPDGERIGYTVADGSLWTIAPDGTGAEQIVEDVDDFDWYRDSRHVIYTRRLATDTELVALALDTGEERSLHVGPFMEIDVAPDGSSVAFCYGPGHMSMGLARLKLEPMAGSAGFPRAVGEPEYVVPVEDGWHIHNGGWSPDSKSIVYTRDQDYGDIFELVAQP